MSRCEHVALVSSHQLWIHWYIYIYIKIYIYRNISLHTCGLTSVYSYLKTLSICVSSRYSRVDKQTRSRGSWNSVVINWIKVFVMSVCLTDTSQFSLHTKQGTLYTENFSLSAAHCTLHKSKGSSHFSTSKSCIDTKSTLCNLHHVQISMRSLHD